MFETQSLEIHILVKMRFIMQDENEVTLLKQTPYRDFIRKYNYDC